MGKTIEERVLELQFDNKQFESATKTSISTLDKLKRALNLDGAAKGIEAIDKASKGLNLATISDGVEAISVKFSALGIMGVTVLQNLTNSALAFGKKIAGAIIDPILEGGMRRAQNIENAKFQLEGLGVDIEKAMAAANYAVTDTAYGLDVAAKAAAQFAASGMEAGEEMGTALRAISGVAAMTNSSYEDMSNIFTTVAGNGRLMGDQLRQLSSRGMNAAAILATELGKTEAQIREMVSKGSISFETFYQAMDKAFGEHATKANETYAGSLANVKANLARIGEPIQTSKMEALKNVFNALLPVIKGIKVELGPVTEQLATMMNILADFAIKKIKAFDFSGIKNWDLTPIINALPVLLRAIENVGVGIKSFVTPIKTAFQEIFPPIEWSSKLVVGFAQKIADLTNKFKMGEEKAANLKRTFKGLFALLDIGKQLISALWNAFKPLTSHISDAAGGLLNFTGNIGDFLVSLNEAIKTSGIFSAVFDRLSGLISSVVKVFKTIGSAISNAFKAFDSSSLTNGLTKFGDSLSKVSIKGEGFGKVMTFISDLLTGIFTILGKLGGIAFDGIKAVLDGISNGLDNTSFDKILQSINTGLFMGVLYQLKNFMYSIKSVMAEMKLDGNLSRMLDQVRTSLFAWQKSLEADFIKKIAISVLILAGALAILTLLDQDKLAASTAAILTLVAGLVAAMKVFNNMNSGIKGFSGILQIFNSLALQQSSKALINLAIAVGILAVAMRILADLEWEDIIQGMTAIIGLMAALVIAMNHLNGFSQIVQKGLKMTPKMVQTGFAMIAFAAAILILASAVKKLSELEWEELGKGVGSVAVMMAALTVAMNFLPKEGKMVSAGIGLMAMATAILILGKAVENMSKMQWDEIGRGLAVMAGALTLVVVAMWMFPNDMRASTSLIAVSAALLILGAAVKQMAKMNWSEIARGLTVMAGALFAIVTTMWMLPNDLKGAATLIAISSALVILGAAVKQMGKMQWDEIGRGLTVLAGALIAIVGVMWLLPGSLSGASALLVISASLIVLSVALKALAKMSIGDIVISLIALAGAFTVIGLAAKLLTPFIGTIAALSGSIALLGLGVAAFGVGVLALGAGLTAIGAGLAAVGGGVSFLVNSVFGVLPSLVIIAKETIINLIRVVTEAMPELGKAFAEIIKVAVDVLSEQAPLIVNAILDMVVQLLTALDDKAPEIADKIFSILIKFLDVLEKRMPELVARGAALINTFMTSIFGDLDKINAGTVIGMLAAVTTLVLVFKLIASAKTSIKDALISAAAIALVMGVLTAMFAIMAAINIDSIMGTALGISALLLSISASMLILGALPIPMALSAIASLGIFVAGLTVILAALGGLAQIPGLSWLIGEGADFLALIGGAIGGFAGSIVAGFGTAISASLIVIGNDLAAFMDAIQSFIEGAKQIDAETLAGVKSLAEMMLILSAGALIDGLTTWLTGGSSMSKFGQMLSDFAPHLVSFANAVKGIDGAQVESSANAAKALAEFANNLPKDGGVWQKLAGTGDLTKFTEELVPFGKAMMRYADTVKGLDASVVENSVNAASAISAMAENLPNQGGVVSWFTGDNNLSLIAKELIPFGRSLKSYSLAVKGIDLAVVENSMTAASAIAAMAENLPNQGGVVSWFTGDNTLSKFGDELVLFGAKFGLYYALLGSINPDVVTSTANAALALAALATNLPNQGGMASWINGDNTLSTFGEELVKFGKHFSKYYSNIADVDATKLTGISEGIQILVDMVSDISAVNLEGLSKFIEDISKLGDISIDEFAKGISSSSGKISDAVGVMMNDISTAISSQSSKAETAMKDLGTNMATKFTTALPEFRTAINDLLSELVTTIEGKQAPAKSAITSLANSMVSAAEAKRSILKPSGEYFVDGLVEGINNNKYKAINASVQLARDVKKGVDDTLGVASPAKEMVKTGGFVVQGLSKGILDNLSVINKSSVEAGTSLITSIQEYLGIHSASTLARDEVGRYFIDGVAEGITANKAAEEAANKKAQAVIEVFKEALSKFSLDLATADLEYSLWEALNPNASANDAKVAKTQQLQQKMAAQSEKAALAHGEYSEIVKRLGEDSLQAQEAYNRYLQEAINLAQLQNELDTLNKSQVHAAEDQNAALREYAEFMNKHSEEMIKQGWTLQEIQKAAAKSFGLTMFDFDDPSTTLENATATLMPILDGEKELYVDVGEEFAKSIGVGIQNESESPKIEATKASIEGANAVKEQEPEWVTGGGFVVQGFANGITANTPIAVDAASAMAAEALAAAMAAIGAASPAKRFIELGKYSDQGMAVGFKKYSYLAENEAARVGTSALDAMQNVISRIADYVSGDLDMTPTITPVLDMSELQKNANQVSTMFGKTSIHMAIKASGDVSTAKAVKVTPKPVTETPVEQKFEFTQNNYSPKPLSRIEIYRQTKNQFAALKGAVSDR